MPHEIIASSAAMSDKESSPIFVCPTDHTPLSAADLQLIAHVNRAIAAGQITNRAGRLVDQPLGGGLIREDKTLLYPVFDGIPVLLADEAILLSQLDN